MFMRNAWYVVAWSAEVKRSLFARVVCGEPIVLFRKQDGTVAALSDRCPHRFAPLHRGSLLDNDVIQCAYHGLEYGTSGQCVRNPNGNGVVPKAAVLRKYPVVERYSLIWLWWGTPEEVDEALIPNFGCLVDPQYRTVGGVIQMAAHYELIADNLMDLSHVGFLHAGILGSEAIPRGKHKVRQDGNTVHSNRWCPDGIAPPAWGAMFDNYTKPVDHWLDMRWNAPAHMLLDVGITPTGRPRSEGIAAWGTDILTPESDTSTHYFWAISRNWALGDPNVDETWRKAIDIAFGHQDKPMIEAVQQMMGSTAFEELAPVLLDVDAGAMLPRRLLTRFIAEERKDLART